MTTQVTERYGIAGGLNSLPIEKVGQWNLAVLSRHRELFAGVSIPCGKISKQRFTRAMWFGSVAASRLA
ncbi:MAG: hypothetical protein AAGC55_21820, partial [Myxococcota bacterium]